MCKVIKNLFMKSEQCIRPALEVAEIAFCVFYVLKIRFGSSEICYK